MASPPNASSSFTPLLDALLHYYPLIGDTDTAATTTLNKSCSLPNAHLPALPSRPDFRRKTRSSMSLPPWPLPTRSSGSRFVPRESQNKAPDIKAPTPQPHSTLRADLPKPEDITHLSPSGRSRGANKENMFPLDDPLSPSSPYSGRNAKGSASPSRPPKLSALSPLQTFSPLQPVKAALPPTTASSDAGSISGRSRASSVTKSLSRRQSLIAHAAGWAAGGKEDIDQNDSGNLFSRLTLVKAPAADSSAIRRHNRSKSSSALAPFTSFAAASDMPATSNRGPRRSFAASSFGGMSPLPIARSPMQEMNTSLHRVGSFHGGESLESGIQTKRFSPDEVVDIARQLTSPVMMPEGGFKGAELKRRKSAGASSRPGVADQEKPPVALEPVEYTQMEEDVLLPFVDRPQEVTELIAHPANESLFKLLRAAFPKDPARPNWREIEPDLWNWEEFMKHLSKIGRNESPDYDWIFRARQAVRARSVALWEKLGVCLGCDGDLLNAGGEDDIPPSWGGLGLGDEGEYDPTLNQVWIEGLEAVDPNEASKAERALAAAFGEIVEDEDEQAAAGMKALLGSSHQPGGGMGMIGEMTEADEGITPVQSQFTTAQKAGNKDKFDPILSSPTAGSRQHLKQLPSTPPKVGTSKNGRSKSFVGLQICTSPTLAKDQFIPRSPSSQLQTPVLGGSATLPVYERGPGSPLFPSSFSSLSAEPNLGRSASVAIHGSHRPLQDDLRGFSGGNSSFGPRGLMRKPSGAGLSESAITFASESEYSHSHGDGH
ncbi:uncharacterized protein I303_101915 [Kwoniella dejecticola CBS 10117]|uniref:Uncharacterized protein n=1 Tax=Kwoniella dejecticola CBS 10117 TaxID=1296121 RepID=A0A1A6ACE4_9TREE|nr:uncharacterized protein I303_01949 [Kwoniella dejecticola CBS 10117]OBR87737.1 hypothetical protein I303_01949 [Kwoniella dejecticola CBS 10117]